MNACRTLLFALLISSSQSFCSHHLPHALTYTPVFSDQTKIIVGGTSISVAALSFWLLHQLKCAANEPDYKYNKKKQRGALQEMCAIVASPFKAILDASGITTNKENYPSAFSYFNITVSCLLAYLAGKYAFNFTPEGKFITAQNIIREVIQNPTFQELTQNDRDLLTNINLLYSDRNHPHVKARNFFSTIKDSLQSAYHKLTGAKTIQDTTAASFIPELQHIARTQEQISNQSILTITSTPDWSYRLKSYIDAQAHKEKMRLAQERLELQRRNTWAREHKAYNGQKHYHYYGEPASHKPACGTSATVAYPPSRSFR